MTYDPFSDTPLTDALTQKVNEKLEEIGHKKRLDINKIKKQQNRESYNKQESNHSSIKSEKDENFTEGEPPWTSLLL